jgi:AmiR/NasT family two-component response regulator
MALRLHLDEGTLGGINFYSTISDEVRDDARVLQTRWAIGQAIGILTERDKMNEDRAFAFLVRASSHGNIKLRDVAQEVEAEANGG